MKRLIVASAIALITTQGFSMDSLSDLSWKNRVVLVFGSTSDTQVEQQLDLLMAQDDALKDRDMVVIRISGEKAVTVHGARVNRDAAQLRRDAGITTDGFQVVLVGKDGGVKLRSDEVVGDAEMFGLIDSMPMRRAGKG